MIESNQNIIYVKNLDKKQNDQPETWKSVLFCG